MERSPTIKQVQIRTVISPRKDDKGVVCLGMVDMCFVRISLRRELRWYFLSNSRLVVQTLYLEVGSIERMVQAPGT